MYADFIKRHCFTIIQYNIWNLMKTFHIKNMEYIETKYHENNVSTKNHNDTFYFILFIYFYFILFGGGFTHEEQWGTYLVICRGKENFSFTVSWNFSAVRQTVVPIALFNPICSVPFAFVFHQLWYLKPIILFSLVCLVFDRLRETRVM